VVVVLAEASAGEANRARALRQAEHEVLHAQRAEVLVLDRGDRLAGFDLWVVHQLLDVVDRGDRRAGFFEAGHYLVEVAGPDPASHDVIELIAVANAFAGGLEPGLLGDVRASDQSQDPFGYRGRARRDRDPEAVARHVGVARSVVGGAIAVPSGDDPELVVDAGARTEQCQQWLEER